MKLGQSCNSLRNEARLGNKFDSSKLNGRGNGGYHEEDKEGHSYYGSSSSSDGGNEKPRNGKRRPNSLKEKREKLRCYFCKGSHMKRDCPKVSSVSAIKRSDELEEAELVEKKASRVNTMILVPKKRNGGEGLIFIDINIAGQERSALVDTGASNLFILEKAARKLSLSSRKLNKKIKMVSSEEVSTMGVVRNVELQISEWKGKEDFKACLYPWPDQIHIVTGPLTKIMVPVHRDMKVGTKVFSSIQLVEDISYGRNIDSIERISMKDPLEVLVA
ncbi:hypothetical protein J1N35_037099 [Gossypium stocksii]|uniref:CCHC-type domain-containing protein n=1 Tax=Gossypium stocksii TaxID=47602 RepID=A0A9D3UJ84_9ROSI|nr:hypothetical protein J1N35_037099 [Gossypium stocksii]